MNEADYHRLHAVIGKTVLRSIHGPDPGFSADERRVWLLGQLSSFCNMTGFQNFFREGICCFYDDILAELRAIGATGMAVRMVVNKRAVLGEKPVPYDDLDSLDRCFVIDGELNEELVGSCGRSTGPATAMWRSSSGFFGRGCWRGSRRGGSGSRVERSVGALVTDCCKTSRQALRATY